MVLDIVIVDHDNNIIDTNNTEYEEQMNAHDFILEDDIVLELGARYGSVSCVINKKIKNKKNQVSVEPDKGVFEALEINKNKNNCDFNIVNGFISKKKMKLVGGGYGITAEYDENSDIPIYSLDEIKKKFIICKFNVLVADCEGCLGNFLIENPEIYDDLRMMLFERDYEDKCDYDNIVDELTKRNFKGVKTGFQNVFIKEDYKKDITIETIENVNYELLSNLKSRSDIYYFFIITFILLIIIYLMFCKR